MDRVSRRDFLHNTNRYIEPGEFIITNRGIDEYVVSVMLPNVTTKEEEVRDSGDEVTTLEEKLAKLDEGSSYGEKQRGEQELINQWREEVGGPIDRKGFVEFEDWLVKSGL